MKVCILWHMHQPDYRPPHGGRSGMPWVRLHAAKDYMDMARLAQEAPDSVHVTFNLTPVLLDQLGELAVGKLDDEFLAVTRKDARDLSPPERAYVLHHFFSAGLEHQIRPLPRYDELRARRERLASSARLVESFSDRDLRDLVVLFHLAWSGTWLRREPVVRALLAKGRDFSEDDKLAILAAHDAQARAIIPLHRELARTGKIELSTTPLYHPILPLLVDLSTASEARPGCSTGGVEFRHPEDATAQMVEGLARAEKHLGVKPRGVWPSEGSISEPVLGILERAGVAWLGADEQVLRKSLAGRGGDLPHLRPWRLHGRGPALFCRDTTLSDLIGFSYARRESEDAARDFVSRLRALERGWDGRDEPIVNVILDGENAWEHYPENGSLFLRALYEALGKSPGIEATTPGRLLDGGESTRELPRLSPGSWIYGNFDTWAGHEEKNRAWALLSAVRREVGEAQARGTVPPEVIEVLYRAEGSDWFWWLGDDHPTAYLSEFESLFRLNLSWICARIGRTPPTALAEPIPRRRARVAFEPPQALITPKIDGRSDHYYDWIGSGVLRPEDGAAMRPGATPLVRELRVGFDHERVYLRLDPERGRDAALRAATVRLVFSPHERSPRAFAWTAARGLAGERDGAPDGAQAVCDRVLELALRRVDVALAPGTRATLAVEVEANDGARERLPREGEIELVGPDPDWDLRHWTL